MRFIHEWVDRLSLALIVVAVVLIVMGFTM